MGVIDFVFAIFKNIIKAGTVIGVVITNYSLLIAMSNQFFKLLDWIVKW